MPSIRKVTPEEVQTWNPDFAVAHEYDSYIADFSSGDFGIIDLATGENRNAVRYHLTGVC